MSNRMIKDSMLTSDKIATLSDFEFRLWIGLILSVDDIGRGDARTAIIKGRVFPLRERVTMREIDDALHGLAAKGCVSLYEVGGKPYFWFPTWGKHQRIRDVKPKYPGPEEEKPICGSLPQTAADCGKPPPETKPKPNQTETKIELEPQPKDETETEPPERGGSAVGIVDVIVGAGVKMSQKARAELVVFLDAMGEECVLKALEVAQEAGKLTWGYIRGTLENKQDQGVHSVEEWGRQEESRTQWLKRKHGSQAIAGTPRDVQPSPERVKQNSDWLEEFLKQQEGKM